MMASYPEIVILRMAKRSATECAAILDICQRLGIIDEKNYLKSRELLMRIVGMLIKMAKAFDKCQEKPHAGTGTHTGTIRPVVSAE